MQYMKNWEIVVRHLGMIELEGSHTAALIKTKIEDLVHDIGLDMNQIYSITTDNGANVLRASKNILEEVESRIPYGVSDDERMALLEQARTEFEDAAILEADEEQSPSVVRQAEEAIRQFTMNEEELRCCAHVIQLAVNDFLSRHREKIEEVKKKAKRIQDHLRKTPRSSRPNLPELANLTRWSSTYYMVSYLN